MIPYHNPLLKKNSQILRKSMTKEEKHLWYDFLKDLPVTFHRQKIIDVYIVDFYCASAKLAIELDGSQHYSDEGLRKDSDRDDYLSSLGIKVLRYTNLQIQQDFHSVCEDIYSHIESIIP